jgi:hypothetical protein
MHRGIFLKNKWVLLREFAMSEGTIEHEIECIGCGYNLRGLPSGDICPGCGGAIQPPVESTDLSSHDRRWLRYVSSGLQLALIRYFILVSYPLFRLINYIDTPEVRAIERFFRRQDIGWGLLYLYLAVFWPSYWLLTADPGRAIPPVSRTGWETRLRRPLRVFAGIMFVCSLFYYFPPHSRHAEVKNFLWTAGRVRDFISLVLPVMFWTLIQKDIAVRTRQETLGLQAEWVKLLEPAVVVITLYIFGTFETVILRQLGIYGGHAYLLLDICHVVLYAWAITILFQLLKPIETALHAETSASS